MKLQVSSKRLHFRHYFSGNKKRGGIKMQEVATDINRAQAEELKDHMIESIKEDVKEEIQAGEKTFTGIKEIDLALVDKYLPEVLDECDFIKLKGGVKFHCNHKNGKENVVKLERLTPVIKVNKVIKAGRCEECDKIFYVVY